MALTSALNVLRCKETLTMWLTSAPKVLRCKETRFQESKFKVTHFEK